MATRFIDKEYGATSSTAIADDATGTRKVQNLPDAVGIVYDKVDNTFKFNRNGSIVSLLDSGIGALTKNVTFTDATLAATNTNQLMSKITLTPASTVTAANGLNAFRGEVNLTSGKTLGDGTSSFVVGTYGRANVFGTVDIGSGSLAAVYAKSDFNGSTITTGYVAPLQANIVNPPSSGATKVDLLYLESASGTTIGSIIRAYASATYFADLTDVGATYIVASAVGGSQNKKLKCNIGGTTYYIPLNTA